MGKSKNLAILIGTLGKDVELKHGASGKAFASFSLATTEKYKDDKGVLQEVTEWHNIVVFGAQAENCAKYIGKGHTVSVEGKIQYRFYDDQETGKKIKYTQILANDIGFLGAPQGRSHNSGGGAPAQEDASDAN